MSATCIPYTRIPHVSPLLTDYLYHFNRVGEFYNGSPFDLQSYRTISEAMPNIPRGQMCEILSRQNQAFGNSAATQANIERLSDRGTFAVVTGQQVGLFSGPAFTLYKALTTVRLAQHLSNNGLRCVPVFWLATEDHDLEEVSSDAVFNEDYDLVTLHDSGNRPAARSSVGEVRHTDQVSAALNQLESLLPEGDTRAALLQDLRDCYAPGTKWGASFGKFMARLFGRWGVILLDPLDPAIHGLARGVYRQAVERVSELRAGVQQNSRKLVQRGYHAQVHVPDDATLLFISRHGDRLPLHQRGGKFFIGEDEEIPLSGILTLLDEQPLDFSPNVLLRPLVQDWLLPTLAYVAGPSELAYLGQAQPLYKALSRPQPVAFSRAAFTLVDARVDRLMEKYKLTVDDALQGEEQVSKKISEAGFVEGWSERFDQTEQELDRALDRLRNDIEKLDPTLIDTLQHAKEKMKYQLERLRGKLSRAALGRSELLQRHMQAVSNFLTPHKDLQERRVSGAYFLGRAGYELLEKVLAHIQVGCSDHQTLRY